MDLKAMLGEELYSQVIEKAGEHKLAIVSDGSYIPKAKFDAKNDEVKDLKDEIKQRDTQLEELSVKAKGNEDLLKEIDNLKTANQQTATDYQAKLDKQAFEFALEKALSQAQAKNPKAVKALLNTEAIKVDGESLLGLEEQLKALKESDAYLFGEEPKLKGRQPNVGGGEPTGMTKEQFDQLSYQQKVELYNSDLETYQKFI